MRDPISERRTQGRRCLRDVADAGFPRERGEEAGWKRLLSRRPRRPGFYRGPQPSPGGRESVEGDSP